LELSRQYYWFVPPNDGPQQKPKAAIIAMISLKSAAM